jgi:hypothetical protein
MFGTIGHFQPIPGQETQVQALIDDWERTIRPTVPGAVTTLRGRCTVHDGELIVVVMMQDEETYRALAANPEQDRWYHRLREHLQRDPEWEDIAWDRIDRGAGGATA